MRLETIRYFFVGKYGFVRWGFAGFVRHVWWRIKHGFWVTDLYGMDVALAEWFSPRLRELAYSRSGCPFDYGMTDQQREEFLNGNEEHEPDFDKWTIDLLKASETMESFLFYARDGGLDGEEGETEEMRQHRIRRNFEEENKTRAEYAKVMHWVADHIGSMWV